MFITPIVEVHHILTADAAYRDFLIWHYRNIPAVLPTESTLPKSKSFYTKRHNHRCKVTSQECIADLNCYLVQSVPSLGSWHETSPGVDSATCVSVPFSLYLKDEKGWPYTMLKSNPITG